MKKVFLILTFAIGLVLASCSEPAQVEETAPVNQEPTPIQVEVDTVSLDTVVV